MRILVAEDDTDAAKLYKVVLEERGHVVVNASDGRRCLNLYKASMADLDSYSKGYKRTPYDAVVLDHMMPFVTGLEAAREILSICPDQRIIIASAYLKDSLKDSLNFISKVVEIMLKPFEPEMLADAIEDMSVVEKLQKLNTKAYSENSDIDKLITELRAIQKPGTI